MQTNRRDLLLGGGAIVVAASGGTLQWAYAQEGEFANSPAYGPWRTWNQTSVGHPMALVQAGILAANPFNTQPWLFKVSDDRIEIFCDPTRNLGAFDGHLREAHFSLGCAITNMLLAAPVNGFTAKVTYVPGRYQPPPAGSAPRHAATVELTKTAALKPSVLYAAIPERRTNRNQMDASRPVPPAVKAAMLALAKGSDARLFLFDAPGDRAKVAQAILDSGEFLDKDPAVPIGRSRWSRHSTAEEIAHLDGSYTAPPPGAAKALGYGDIFPNVPMFGLITVRDRFDIGQTLRAGRLWQGLHLLITARGLNGRPSNAVPELLDHETGKPNPATTQGVLDLVGDPTWQPMFMFYTGYATAQGAHSARRPVEKAIIA